MNLLFVFLHFHYSLTFHFRQYLPTPLGQNNCNEYGLEITKKNSSQIIRLRIKKDHSIIKSSMIYHLDQDLAIWNLFGNAQILSLSHSVTLFRRQLRKKRVCSARRRQLARNWPRSSHPSLFSDCPTWPMWKHFQNWPALIHKQLFFKHLLFIILLPPSKA